MLFFSHVFATPFCPDGIRVTHYNDELFFSGVIDEHVVESIDMTFKNGYDSYVARGSFCPTKDGYYRFKVSGKHTVSLTVSGKEYGSIGPGGGCLPSSSQTKESDKLYLHINQCYSLQIQLRTGCNLYSQFFQFYVSYEDGPYELATNMVDCIIDGCIPGYYGANCTNQCTVDCHGHGHCDDGVGGTGQCICDEGYDQDSNCEHESVIVPPDCYPGIMRHVYSNEISFSGLKEEKAFDNLTFTNLDSFSYNSIIFDGSAFVTAAGQYQFRIIGKPYAQFNFQSTSTPSSLGPAGSCLGSIHVDEASPVFNLKTDITYPFSIKYRGGCPAVSRNMKLQWKNGPKHFGIDKAPWEDTPSFYLFRCKNQDCVPGKYGDECELSCPPFNEHQICNDGRGGDGTISCKPGYYGEDCYDTCDDTGGCMNNGKCLKTGNQSLCYCEEGYFSEHCEVQCSRDTQCHSHGNCNSNGACVCDTGWFGTNCEREVEEEPPEICETGAQYKMFTTEVNFDSILEQHIEPAVNLTLADVMYRSMRFTGSIVLPEDKEVQFRIRAKPYAQLTINHISVPSALGLAGACSDTITTLEESDKMTLKKHKYYPFSLTYRSGCSLYDQYVFMEWKPKGVNDFVPVPGEYIQSCVDRSCEDRYSGAECTNYCTVDCGEHGSCSIINSKSVCVCDEDYFGSKCETYCNSQDTCGGWGVCGDRGICECSKGFTGPNCTTKIDDSTTGISVSCANTANLKWHTNEYFGTQLSSSSLETVDVPIAQTTSFRSITISGSLSAPETCVYRFKAEGKPLVHLTIDGVVVDNQPGFDSGTCDDDEQYAESQPAEYYVSKLIPFQLQYKSGCGRYAKHLRLLYQQADEEGTFVNSTWEVVTSAFLRNCNWNECEVGHYGLTCSKQCVYHMCGDHGRCKDGMGGDGSCQCDTWYIGAQCSLNSLFLIVGSFATVLFCGLAWACWPTSCIGSDDPDNSQDDSEATIASTHRPASMHSSLIN